jgi:hypothetical protein
MLGSFDTYDQCWHRGKRPSPPARPFVIYIYGFMLLVFIGQPQPWSPSELAFWVLLRVTVSGFAAAGCAAGLGACKDLAAGAG